MTEQEPRMTEAVLFDKLPSGVQERFDEASIRLMFDGTLFNGANGVRVDFDEHGEVKIIESTNLFTGEAAPSFTFGKTGGFVGEGGFYGNLTVLGKRLTDIVEQTKGEWQMWKDTEEQHPGVDFRQWKTDKTKAMTLELDRLQTDRFGKTYSEAMQRHHDYYVELKRSGKLTDSEVPSYELAVSREKQGLVKPLK